jgi:capsular polysaccharide biosynthesis protein
MGFLRDHVAGSYFFWRARGCVSSLTNLDKSHGLLATWNFNNQIQNSDGHDLSVVELEDGKVVGEVRLAATHNDIALGGVQALRGCANPHDHYTLKQARFRRPVRYRGTALLIGTATADNYFSWLLESVPRLKLAQAASKEDYDFVLLQTGSPRFQKEVLDRAGVPEKKRLHCSKWRVYQFDRLVVPAMPFPVQHVSQWACEWVRSLFPERNPAAPERLYITRRQVNYKRLRRRLVNEEQLEARLKMLGFTIVQPENKSVAEQAQLFGAAKCVVAPHGAGCANLLFSPPGALLIELFDPGFSTRSFEHLSTACKHRYVRLMGRQVGKNVAAEHSLHPLIEYEIDISQLEQHLAENGII